MPLGRAFLKTAVTEIALTSSESYSPGVIAPAGIFESKTWNLQYAQFLQPVGATLPQPSEKIAPGHVVYWGARYTGATTVTVSIFGTSAPGATPIQIISEDVAVVTTVMTAFRTDKLGAFWSIKVRMTNTGAAATGANTELCVAVRCY